MTQLEVLFTESRALRSCLGILSSFGPATCPVRLDAPPLGELARRQGIGLDLRAGHVRALWRVRNNRVSVGQRR